MRSPQTHGDDEIVEKSPDGRYSRVRLQSPLCAHVPACLHHSALFLGAIGVASAIHVYVRQKIETVAVLRCLGASARQGFGVYLVQGAGIGLFGAGVGALLGILVQVALPPP